MDDKKSFLGTGWSFPPTFDKQGATVVMVSEEKDIKQSLRLILNTSYGERVMRPGFGSNLSAFVFNAMDSVAVNALTDSIEQAIDEFEPRVDLNEVNVSADRIHEGRLDIEIDYTVKSVNVRYNIVFPYYFKEGTNVVDM